MQVNKTGDDMKKVLVALSGAALVSVALTACGGSASCTPLNLVDPNGDIPSTSTGAASIIAGDPAETGATFGPFYSSKISFKDDEVIASKVTLPGQTPVTAVWYVPQGTHLFMPVNDEAESVTQAGQGLTINVNPPTDSGYKTVTGCVNSN